MRIFIAKYFFLARDVNKSVAVDDEMKTVKTAILSGKSCADVAKSNKIQRPPSVGLKV